MWKGSGAKKDCKGLEGSIYTCGGTVALIHLGDKLALYEPWADWNGDLVTHSGQVDEFKGKVFNLKSRTHEEMYHLNQRTNKQITEAAQMENELWLIELIEHLSVQSENYQFIS